MIHDIQVAVGITDDEVGMKQGRCKFEVRSYTKNNRTVLPDIHERSPISEIHIYAALLYRNTDAGGGSAKTTRYSKNKK